MSHNGSPHGAREVGIFDFGHGTDDIDFAAEWEKWAGTLLSQEAPATEGPLCDFADSGVSAVRERITREIFCRFDGAERDTFCREVEAIGDDHLVSLVNPNEHHPSHITEEEARELHLQWSEHSH